MDIYSDCASFSLEVSTPLHYAAMLRMPRLEEWLLSEGCAVNQVSKYGSPLQCAIFGPASMNLAFYSLETIYFPIGPLDARARETIEFLLVAGANATLKLRDGERQYHSILACLFHSGCDLDEHEIVPWLKLLLAGGAILDQESLEALLSGYNDRKGLTNILETFSEDNIEDSLKGKFIDALRREQCSNAPSWSSPARKAHGQSMTAQLKDEMAASLRLAAQLDQPEKISHLLSNNELDINSFTEDTKTPALYIAASYDSLNALKLLLDLEADPNQADVDGETALHACASSRNGDAVSLLIEKGANIFSMDNVGRTLLDAAAFENNTDVLEVSLLAVETIEGETSRRQALCASALLNAAKGSSDDALLLLTEHMEDPHPKFEDGTTLAHYCHMISPATLRVLIDRGLNLQAMTASGQSPLSVALSKSNDPDVETIALLASSATINLPDSKGWTPLHHFFSRALEFSNGNGILNTLLHRGADTTKMDADGRSPVDVLVDSGAAPSKKELEAKIVLQTVLGDDYNSNAIADDFRRTKALIWAIESGQWDWAQALLRQGTNIGLRVADENKASPLEVICLLDCPEPVFRSFVKRADASLIARRSLVSDRGLLHLICSYESLAPVEHLKILLDSGADVNMTTQSDQKTALILAVQGNKVKHAEILLRYGADIHKVYPKGLNAVQVAAWSGYLEVLVILRAFAGSQIDWKTRASAFHECNSFEKQSPGSTVLHYASRQIRVLE